MTLTNGIFNAGSISAASTTNTNGSTSDLVVTATAIDVGNYVTIGQGAGTNSGGVPAAAIAALPGGATGYALVNTNETGGGSISASLSGAQTGTATAILIEAQKTGGVAGSLASIFNSGQISAQASTTNLDSTGIAAYAIRDESGTLQTIYNTGTISATTTTLDNNAQVADAIDTSSNTTTSVTIMDQSTGANSADIVGDIHYGTQTGTLTVTGTNTNFPALVSGNLFFNNPAGSDTITVNSFGTYAGQIFQAPGGSVDISVASNGAFDLLTSQPTNLNSTVSQAVQPGTPLNVGTLDVATGGNLLISSVAGLQRQRIHGEQCDDHQCADRQYRRQRHNSDADADVRRLRLFAVRHRQGRRVRAAQHAERRRRRNLQHHAAGADASHQHL